MLSSIFVHLSKAQFGRYLATYKNEILIVAKNIAEQDTNAEFAAELEMLEQMVAASTT